MIVIIIIIISIIIIIVIIIMIIIVVIMAKYPLSRCRSTARAHEQPTRRPDLALVSNMCVYVHIYIYIYL